MAHPLKHLHTINKHRFIVFIHCCKAGIPFRGLLHDLSKYSPAEFIPGAIYWTGTRSPNDGERKDKSFSSAWMHHKGRNKHHYEYWTDFSPETGLYEPVKMPLKFVIEMFCDRLAAGKVYKGKAFTSEDPINYFEKRTNADKMHPETSLLLGSLLSMYRDKGESKTFAYIRKDLLRRKTY